MIVEIIIFIIFIFITIVALKKSPNPVATKGILKPFVVSVQSPIAFGHFKIINQKLIKGGVEFKPNEAPLYFTTVSKNQGLLKLGEHYGYYLTSDKDPTSWMVNCRLYISPLPNQETVGTETFKLYTNIPKFNITELDSLELSNTATIGILKSTIDVPPYEKTSIFVASIPSGRSLVSGTLEIIQLK